MLEVSENLHYSSKSLPLVLVVEDDPDNIFLMSYILRSLKVRYIVAKDGKIAFDLVRDKLPNLILLDVVLPEINGIELACLLKTNPLTEAIPIIAVTGLTQPEHKAEIKKAGCEDYICKPFVISELEAKILDFLQLAPA